MNSSRLLCLWLAMIGSVAAARDNKHIRIDLITHVLSGPVVAWAKVIVDLFAISCLRCHCLECLPPDS